MTSPAAAVLLGALSISAPQDPAAPDEARFLSDIRQLTFDGRRAGEGYFDRSGKQLVFQSEREPGNPWYQIYVLDLESGEAERISPGHGKTTCSWLHPDGKRVLYASTHLDPRSVELQRQELELRASGPPRRYEWDYDEHFDLFVFDRATKASKRLTETRGYDAEGSFSPDGQWIAWSSNRHAYLSDLGYAERERLATDPKYFLDLYLMRADGTDLRRLTKAPGYDGGPFFSPDGKRLCFRRFAEDGATAEIYTLEVESGRELKLTSLGAVSWAPFFHSTQEYLIFTTNRHGFANFELYLVDGQGRGEPVRVTATHGFDGLPCFTPDGADLAWTSNRTADQSSQIFRARWNHVQALQSLQETRASAAGAGDALVAAAETWRGSGLVAVDAAHDLLVRTNGEVPPRAAIGRLAAGAQGRANAVWIGARSARDGDAHALGAEVLQAAVSDLVALQRTGKLALERDLVFALWDPELPSFDVRASCGADSISAYLDLSALDGWDGSPIAATGIGTSSGWKALVERANVPAGLSLLAEEPPATSGFAASFAASSIPTLVLASRAATPGSAGDVARAKLVRFVRLLASGAARGPQPLEFTRYERPPTANAAARPWLGTIPDYAPASIPGLKLSGVAPGGPAERAGLRAGDVVVAIGGRAVKGIDDYASALDALKIGSAVPIAVVRDGAKLELEITPAKRDG